MSNKPRSKKPRHKMRHRDVKIAQLTHDKSYVDKVRGRFTSWFISIRLGFDEGFTYDKLSRFRQLTQCAILGMNRRIKQFDQDEVIDAIDFLKSASAQITTIIRRGVIDDKYVINDDEKALLLSNFELVCDFISDSLEVIPKEVAMEYQTSLMLVESIYGTGFVNYLLDKRAIDYAYALTIEIEKLRGLPEQYKKHHQQRVITLRNYLTQRANITKQDMTK